jgi:hypothetical protein
MKKIAILAWILAGLITARIIVSTIPLLEYPTSTQSIDALVNGLIWIVVLPIFAIVAALIVSRQPGNVIGWLFFMPAMTRLLDVEPYIRSFTTPPAQPPLQLLLSLWYYSFSWLLLVFPLFFIPLVFPTGRPPSPRWRWLIFFGLGMCAIFLFLTTFVRTHSAVDLGLDWSLPNPIGFIPIEVFGSAFDTLWDIGLVSMAALSVASLIIRYRRASAQEREQIKWLLYTCALFAVSYIVSIPFNTFWSGTILNRAANVVWGLSLIGIPVSIAIAILRYRLWDIDLIIRRTLQYGLLSVLLGLVYFGMVVLLGQSFRTITGQESPLAVVISTLAIAALFTPLRRRIQAAIDRRFYRQKYNAEQAVAAFATAARSEVELDALGRNLVIAAREALQPESVSLWLNQKKGNR